MAKRSMLWSISKAVVDFDSVADDHILDSLLACQFLARLGLNAEAARDLPAFNLLFDTRFIRLRKYRPKKVRFRPLAASGGV
jgi:hypothetical protein